MVVNVYSKPDCVQCDFTKKRLAALGIAYTEIDVLQDQTAMELVRATGKLQMPYVVAGEASWHGFKPDKIKELAA